MYYVWLKPCSTSKNTLKWWALPNWIHIFINIYLSIYILKGWRGQKVTPKCEKKRHKNGHFVKDFVYYDQVGGLSPLKIYIYFIHFFYFPYKACKSDWNKKWHNQATWRFGLSVGYGMSDLAKNCHEQAIISTQAIPPQKVRKKWYFFTGVFLFLSVLMERLKHYCICSSSRITVPEIQICIQQTDFLIQPNAHVTQSQHLDVDFLKLRFGQF
jgi:hypothetical protein